MENKNNSQNYFTLDYTIINGIKKITKCIDSCKTDIQLDSVEQMIINFDGVYKCNETILMSLFKRTELKRKQLKCN